MNWRHLLTAIAFLVATGAYAQTGLRVPTTKSPAPPPPTVSEDEAERGKTLEQIFECLAAGLPKDWWRAWVEITEKGEVAWNERTLEGRYFFLTDTERSKPRELKSCDAREVADLTVALNKYLDPDKRRWKAARLQFNRDGSFEMKYDYAP